MTRLTFQLNTTFLNDLGAVYTVDKSRLTVFKDKVFFRLEHRPEGADGRVVELLTLPADSIRDLGTQYGITWPVARFKSRVGVATDSTGADIPLDELWLVVDSTLPLDSELGSPELEAGRVSSQELASQQLKTDLKLARVQEELRAGVEVDPDEGSDVITSTPVTGEGTESSPVTLGSRSITNEFLAPNSVDFANIVQNAVETQHLQTDAVTGDKIATDAVTEDSISNQAVSTSKIADDAVVRVKLSPDIRRALDGASGGQVGNIVRDLALDTGSLELTVTKTENGVDSTETIDIATTNLVPVYRQTSESNTSISLSDGEKSSARQTGRALTTAPRNWLLTPPAPSDGLRTWMSFAILRFLPVGTVNDDVTFTTPFRVPGGEGGSGSGSSDTQVLNIRSDVTMTIGQSENGSERGWKDLEGSSQDFGSITNEDRFTRYGYIEMYLRHDARHNNLTIAKYNNDVFPKKVAINDVEYELLEPSDSLPSSVGGRTRTHYSWNGDRIRKPDGTLVGNQNVFELIPAVGEQVDFNILEFHTTDPADDRHLNWVSEVPLTDKDIFTQEEREKLAGIQAGAQVNVQSDWNVTDTDSAAFIKNKPTIPTGGGSNTPAVKYQLRSDLVITSAEQRVLGAGTGTYGWLTRQTPRSANFGTVVSGDDDLSRQGYFGIHWSDGSTGTSDLTIHKEGAATVSPQVITFGDKTYLLSDPTVRTTGDFRTYVYTLSDIQDSDSDNNLEDDGVTDLTTLFGTTGDITCNILEQASDDNARDNSWVGERDLTDFDLYTEAERDKLAGIPANAEHNVQADWGETDATADSFIRRKPPIAGHTDSGSTIVERTDAKLTVGTQTVVNTTYNGIQIESQGNNFGSIRPDILSSNDFIFVKWSSNILSIEKSSRGLIPTKIKFGDVIYTLTDPSIDQHPVFGTPDYDFQRENIIKPDGTSAASDDLTTLFPANEAVVDFNLQQSDGAWIGLRTIDVSTLENVQADWLVSDPTKPDYIKNRPQASVGTSELSVVDSVAALPTDAPVDAVAFVNDIDENANTGFSLYRNHPTGTGSEEYYIPVKLDPRFERSQIWEYDSLSTGSEPTKKVITNLTGDTLLLGLIPMSDDNSLYISYSATRLYFLTRDSEGNWSSTASSSMARLSRNGAHPRPLAYDKETHSLIVGYWQDTFYTTRIVDLTKYISREGEVASTPPTPAVGSESADTQRRVMVPSGAGNYRSTVDVAMGYFEGQAYGFVLDLSDSTNNAIVVLPLVESGTDTYTFGTPKRYVLDPVTTNNDFLSSVYGVTMTDSHIYYSTRQNRDDNAGFIIIERSGTTAQYLSHSALGLRAGQFSSLAGATRPFTLPPPANWEKVSFNTDLPPDAAHNLDAVPDLINKTADLTYIQTHDFETLTEQDLSVRLKLESSTRNARDVAADFDVVPGAAQFNIAANVDSFWYMRLQSGVHITDVRVRYRPTGGDPNGEDDIILPGNRFKSLGRIGTNSYFVLADRVEYPSNYGFDKDGRVFTEKIDSEATSHTHYAGSLTAKSVADAVNAAGLPDSAKISLSSLKDVPVGSDPYTAISTTLKAGTGVSLNNVPPVGSTPGSVTISSASNISTSHAFHLRAQDRVDIHTIPAGASVRSAKLHTNAFLTMAKTIPTPGQNARRKGNGERPVFYETDVHQVRDGVVTYGPIDVDNTVTGFDLTSDANSPPATNFLDAVKGGRYALETINRHVADTDSEIRNRVDSLFNNPANTLGSGTGYSTLVGSSFGDIGRGRPQWDANGYVQLRYTANIFYLTMERTQLDLPREIVFDNVRIVVPRDLAFDVNTVQGLATLAIPANYTGLELYNSSGDRIQPTIHNGQPNWNQTINATPSSNHVAVNIRRQNGVWLYNSLESAEIACVAGHQLWALNVENRSITEKYLGNMTSLLTAVTYTEIGDHTIDNIDLARIDDDGRMLVVMNARTVVSGQTQHRISRVGFIDMKDGAPVANSNTTHSDVVIRNITADAFGTPGHDEITRVCNLRDNVVLMLHKRSGTGSLRATVARIEYRAGSQGGRKTYSTTHTTVGTNTHNNYSLTLPDINSDWRAIYDVKETVDGEVLVVYKGSRNETKSAIISLQSDANQVPTGLTVAAMGTVSNSVGLGSTDQPGSMVHLTPERFALTTRRNDRGLHVDFQELQLQGDNQNNQYLGELSEFNTLLDVDITNRAVDIEITDLSISQGTIKNEVVVQRDDRRNSKGELNEVGGLVQVGATDLGSTTHGVKVVYKVDTTNTVNAETLTPTDATTALVISADDLGGNFDYTVGPDTNEDSVANSEFSVSDATGAMIFPEGTWMVTAAIDVTPADSGGDATDAAIEGSLSFVVGGANGDEVAKSGFSVSEVAGTSDSSANKQRIQGGAEVSALIDSDGSDAVQLILRCVKASAVGLIINGVRLKAVKLAILK